MYVDESYFWESELTRKVPTPVQYLVETFHCNKLLGERVADARISAAAALKGHRAVQQLKRARSTPPYPTAEGSCESGCYHCWLHIGSAP